jgi:P pilus assembly chaperone PapD
VTVNPATPGTQAGTHAQPQLHTVFFGLNRIMSYAFSFRTQDLHRTASRGWAFAAKVAAGLVILATLLLASTAHADLMVFPTRVVFEKNMRAAQLELINNGKDTATYRITVINRRMNELGQFVPADPALPGELFANDLIRYSPRQVVLAPGIGQTVRISLRKPADLQVGEYRSHLQFERLPDSAGSGIDATNGNPAELGVQLKTLVGVSIPLIVRHGDTASSVTLGGLELPRASAGQPTLLSAVLNRTGNSSAYGDLGATFTPHGGVAQEVGKAGGVAVYSPNPLRKVKLELRPPTGVVLERGTLRLSYRERPEAGGRLLAEALLELP